MLTAVQKNTAECVGLRVHYMYEQLFCSSNKSPTRSNNFSSIYLTFVYSSTCFGRLHAHHQELNTCCSKLWFYLRSVVIAVLLVVVGPVKAPQVKPEAATAVVEHLMMGVRTPETC
jgi:hypothetical protein